MSEKISHKQECCFVPLIIPAAVTPLLTASRQAFINACLDAVNNGVTAAGIINGTKQHSCLWEIFSDKGSGTLIRKWT